MSNAPDNKRALVESAAAGVADEYDADIILINAPIDGTLDTDVIKMVTSRKRRKNAIVIIVTEGGSADSAFRIARCFQACYDRFTAVAAGWCKSAGTLIAIGAADLAIGDLGELGPLDVQLAKPDELGLIASGLTVDSSFRSLQAAAFQMFESFLLDTYQKSGGRITTKTAAELAVTMTIGLFSPIFEQMDPLKIGEDYRSTRIAEEYALRLNAHSQNLSAVPGVDPIDALVRGYPSHGFVIDRTEAKTLFRRAVPLDGPLLELVNALGGVAIVPRTTANAQTPILNYLNKEVKNENEVKTGSVNGQPEQPDSSKRAGNKGPAGRRIPANSAPGDRVVALPLAEDPKRAGGEA